MALVLDGFELSIINETALDCHRCSPLLAVYLRQVVVASGRFAIGRLQRRIMTVEAAVREADLPLLPAERRR